MALTKISRGLLDTGVSDSSDATAITIDSSENVGIGVTTPFSQTQITETGWSSGAPYGTVLTVTGNNTNDANWGHLLITDSSTGTGNGGMLRFAVGSTSSDISPHSGIDGFTEGSNYGGLKFLTRPNGGTSTERMRIDSNGKVGIGNTSPSNALTVGSTSVTDSIISVVASSSGFPQIRFSDDASESGQGRVFYDSANDALGFSTAQTERMRIDSSGNVLINATSRQNTGSRVSIKPVGSGVAFETQPSDSNAYYVALFFNNSSAVVGSIYSSTSSTSFNTSSDYRLKENVIDMDNAIDRVKQLKPKRFNFIADADKTVDGFLAHEVSDVVPEAITGEKDGEQMQGMDQSKLVPLLTKAIQELSAKVEELESKINE